VLVSEGTLLLLPVVEGDRDGGLRHARLPVLVDQLLFIQSGFLPLPLTPQNLPAFGQVYLKILVVFFIICHHEVSRLIRSCLNSQS
jgi:hypothetical protein